MGGDVYAHGRFLLVSWVPPFLPGMKATVELYVCFKCTYKHPLYPPIPHPRTHLYVHSWYVCKFILYEYQHWTRVRKFYFFEGRKELEYTCCGETSFFFSSADISSASIYILIFFPFSNTPIESKLRENIEKIWGH